MFTVQDIQRRYGVTVQTVLGWIRSGELRALHVGRRPGAKKPRWRIPQASLDAFEALRATSAPLPKARRRKHPAEVIEFYK
jgi:excisionase family DNA binding protein